MNIFVLKLYFRLKIYFKKCKFHFQLAFFKGEDCSELRFAWKYDALPSTIEKQFPCRVCTRHVEHIVLCALLDWLSRIGRITKFIWQYFRDEILPCTRNSACFLSGEQHTPATGVNKCSNPDEGASNEVSSLANEKFISSRNTYGAKGKAVRVSGGVFSHHIGSPTRHSGVLGCT